MPVDLPLSEQIRQIDDRLHILDAIAAAVLVLALAGCSNLDSSTQASDDNSSPTAGTTTHSALDQESTPADTRVGADAYDWTDGEVFLEDYTVVFIKGLAPAAVLRALGTVRRDAGRLNVMETFELNDSMTEAKPDILPIFSVAKTPGGVVVFSTHGYLDNDRVALLSRGGIAATLSTSINADYRITVARNGKVVRDFDPFLDPPGDGSLPEERGLDLENDTSPASWALLERLTSIHVTEDWVLEQRHPTYVLTED